jgi:AcrR family transcriptional regulator
MTRDDDRNRRHDPQRLPAGRHRLDPQFVAAHQRERVLRAVTDVAATDGYGAMTIDDIVREAGVSRRDFYAHFSGKEDAFLAAYDAAAAQIVQSVEAAGLRGDSLPERAHNALAAMITFVVDDPPRAAMSIVEIRSLGPEGAERRNAVLRRFVAVLERAVDETLPAGHPRPPALTTTTVLGGISEVIYSRLVRGDVAELPRLLPDLAYSLVLPFLGPEAAADTHERLSGERASQRSR